MTINKEPLSMRDEFAANIAGTLVAKSDIKVDADEFWLRKVGSHNSIQLDAIAYLAYKLADKLLTERVKKD